MKGVLLLAIMALLLESHDFENCYDGCSERHIRNHHREHRHERPHRERVQYIREYRDPGAYYLVPFFGVVIRSDNIVEERYIRRRYD